MPSQALDVQFFATRLAKCITEGLQGLVGTKVDMLVASSTVRKLINEFLLQEHREGSLRTDPDFFAVMSGSVALVAPHGELLIDVNPLLQLVQTHPSIRCHYGVSDTSKPRWSVWAKKDLTAQMLVHADSETAALQAVAELSQVQPDDLDACRMSG